MTEETSRFAHLKSAALSDIGRKRKNNEDSYGAFAPQGVWCVADGMGGGDDGEVASAAVVKSVDAYLSDLPAVSAGAYSGVQVAKGVIGAVEEASGWIFRRTKSRKLKGCGSTFVGIVFDATNPGAALALHVGDSRLYRLRGRDFRQITKDHSVAEMMGAKDEKDLNPMFRGMILRAVGIEGSVQVDETPLSVEEGDVILICSDGLSRMVPDKRISEIIREGEDDVEETARRLVAAANRAGGVDNITVELIRVGALPPALPLADIARNENSSHSSTTLQTLDREYNGAGRRLLSRDASRRLLIGAGAAAVAAGVGWMASLSFVREKPRIADVPSIEAMPTSGTVRAESPANAAPAPAPAVGTNETATAAATSVATVASTVTAAPPAEDASTAASEDRERDVVEEELRAERERRRRADAAAAGVERERQRAAQDLAKTYDRGFAEFAGFVNAVFGKGTCDRAQTLGRQLAGRQTDANANMFATDFTVEIANLAERLVAKCDRKPLRKDDTIVRLVTKCREIVGKDPALPETQLKCRELIDFVVARRMQNNGRK